MAHLNPVYSIHY